MARDEWYRRTTWTPEDEADFFTRLQRTRHPGDRAQRLRIQAVHLRETAEPDLLRSAIILIDYMVANEPDSTQLAAAYWCKAQCHAELSEIDAAVEAFRQSFEAQRTWPHSRTDAYLDFGLLVTERGLTALYPEALAALEEFGGDEAFPKQQYRAAAIRAQILDAWGRAEEARLYAREALQAAERTHSGFRYHATLGLVTDRDTLMHGRLRRLATV